ncbi:MAG: glycosyltransferase [Candidatus Dormiibacterota bacterium]
MFRDGDRLRDRVTERLFRVGAGRCGAVVCNSQVTRDHLGEFDAELASRASVIPWGHYGGQVSRRERCHIVAFAGSHARKRSDLLAPIYEAFQRSERDPVPLVVLARAGLAHDVRRALEELGAEIYVNVDETRVGELLATARALVVTSRQEGFGLPVVEAGEVGTPVVLGCDSEVAEEVIGRHCVRAAGLRMEDWAEALRCAVELGPVDHALSLPTWAEVCERYRETYERVCS